MDPVGAPCLLVRFGPLYLARRPSRGVQSIHARFRERLNCNNSRELVRIRSQSCTQEQRPIGPVCDSFSIFPAAAARLHISFEGVRFVRLRPHPIGHRRRGSFAELLNCSACFFYNRVIQRGLEFAPVALLTLCLRAVSMRNYELFLLGPGGSTARSK